MNKRNLGVAAVFLVGCAVGGASSQLVVPKASAQQAATLTKWEYYCDTDSFGVIVGSFNKVGAEGWELVSVSRLSSEASACFKRPRGSRPGHAPASRGIDGPPVSPDDP